MTPTYCAYAFNKSIHYDVKERVAPCCQFRSDNDPIGLSPKEYYDSDFLKNIKQLMTEGKPVNGCERCYHHEELGAQSLRQVVNKNQKTKLHLTYSNICNKSCNVCRPQRSHLVANEYKKVLEQESNNKWLNNRFENQPMTKKMITNGNIKLESLVSKIDNKFLDEVIHHVDTIELDGGEPFMHPELSGILQQIIDAGYNKKIHIIVSTNGSVTKEYLRQLCLFKSVKVRFSVDGINGLYEVVRPPHKWEWFTERADLVKSYSHIKRGLNCVIHVFNIHQLPDIIEYCIAEGMNYTITPLAGQSYLSGALVPSHVIQDVCKKLDNLNADPVKIQNIITHLKVLDAKVVDSIWIDMFKEYVSTFKRIHNRDFQKHISWDLTLQLNDK